MLVKKIKYLVVSLILLVVLYLLGSAYWERVKETRSAKNLESGVILYDLEGYKFNVPLKYYYLIYQKTGVWPTPKKERQSVKSFEIDVVLPEMLPYSEQTAEKFEARGWKDEMWITLSRRNKVMDDFGGWFQKWKHQFSVVGESSEAPGLVYLIDHQGPVDDEDKNYNHMFLKSVDNFDEYFYISCVRNLKEGGVPFPSCKLNTKYGELKMELTFSRKYLRDWTNIMAESAKLLDSFRVSTN